MNAEKALYEVVVGAFGLWYNANLVNDQAHERGLTTSICKYRGKYCVFAGPFANEEDARNNLLHIQKTGYVFAYIINV